MPEDISKEEYAAVRNSWHSQDGKFPDWYIGAVGYLASFNAKFFGGYAGIGNDKGKLRYYYDESKRNLSSQLPHLKDVEFEEKDYRSIDLSTLQGGVIYCDIPYQNTTGYQQEFDHETFWRWAEEAAKTNVVLVSEQTAPASWRSIWSKPVKRTLNAPVKFEITERLYLYDNNKNFK